ncbi:CLUMA_CG004389, isoform A [Clunio marinus]|uniref:CLUMA_CG004389, isoform A n=1 Tax=Clunio marinus TaxID=568069 RepID=A0A1J1HTI3_9DIPT|nr:CLUMA_CG004389, isoform A [Clunio marinus]
MPSSSEKNCSSPTYSNEDAKNNVDADLVMLEELKVKCRTQTEQIMAWKKAYSMQSEQHFREQLEKTDQLSYLTGQLLLLESRLVRKQKQIANILYQRELTIYRQQKIIEALSSRLEMHGLDNQINIIDNQTECDLNDSDSAVVLEDIDDCNSLILKRKSCSSDVVRSISDVIQMPRRTNLQKSNCYLRRPDILETVYSVEEDPEQNQQEQSNQQANSQQQSPKNQSCSDVAEKRDKFKNRSDKRITDIVDDQSLSNVTDSISTNQSSSSTFWEKLTSYYDYASRTDSRASTPIHRRRASDEDAKSMIKPANQVTNFNRVMSNHRSVTKPKDVKYKRINKAKSKSLEELRGKLKNWVEHRNSGSYNLQQEGKSYDDA